MTTEGKRLWKPLLAVAVADRRTAVLVLVATLLVSLTGWAITSILAGVGRPFEYAIRAYSIGELRILLWSGTGVLTAAICGVGWSFIGLGRSLWRDAQGTGFGLRFVRNGDGVLFDRLVRWYGGVLVAAGLMLIPLGGSLLVILASCRYMRDV